MDAYGLANADAVVPGVKSGDPAAQEALYRAFEAPVYNLARRICRTTEDAEDVLQETFFEVFRSIGRYRGDGSLWGWIRTIASSKGSWCIRPNGNPVPLEILLSNARCRSLPALSWSLSSSTMSLAMS